VHCGTPLGIGRQLGLLAVMLLTSKGAAGVAGGGFIAVTATLSTLGTVPAAAIMLIFGIDKFMSECRALVNFYGNAVATLVTAKWDKALDIDQARRVLAGHTAPTCRPATRTGKNWRTGAGNVIRRGHPVAPSV
jgi:aerobic C4-dicarboxylate transport protein